MILSGCDCGAFSAGGDLQRVHGRLIQGRPITDPDAADLFAASTSRTKPIIAALGGVALGGGLVQALTIDRPAMFERATVLAGEIARCAPSAVRAIRHVVMTGIDLPSGSAEQFSEPYRDAAHGSADALEGVTAFLEKREPSWVMGEK